MAHIPWKDKQRERESGREPSPLSSLRQEMERLLDTYVREPFGGVEWPFGERAWSPTVDLWETEKEILVRAELPGVDPQELELTVTGNQLVLAGEKKGPPEQQGSDLVLNEIRYGSFRRAIPLSVAVEASDVQAEYAHGMLTIRLPKPQAAVRRIEIKST